MSDQKAFFHEGELVSVLTSEPIDRFLDYKAPEGGCHIGAFVEVPLGPRQVLGVVWNKGRGDFDITKIRPVRRVLDVAPMREDMRTFLEKLGTYTVTPMSQVLRLATRAPGLGNPQSMQKVYRLGQGEPDRPTKAREKVIAVLKDYGGFAFTLGELANLAGVSTSVVKGLAKQGVVFEENTPRDQPYPKMDLGRAGIALNAEQSHVAEVLRQTVRDGGYSTSLLQGVTGSGKTEVFLEAVQECLKKGRQVLVLLPEISLTNEFLERVKDRFGVAPAEWHSGVTMTERRRCWRMVGQGGADLVVGARSALFLPFRDLGLIIVDEEHDTSYKQEDGAIYSARDMAVMRASFCEASVVLASATPSLESWVNAKSGKYRHLRLTERIGDAVLPKLAAIDMRAENLPAGRWLSESLVGEVRARIERGEQSLLFLNRRGYAPITMCRACGQQVGCDHCDARMVEHRFLKRLICHQCGETRPIPDTCPSCDAEDRMAAVGPGVERIAEEVAVLFPEARLSVLSSDLFGSARSMKEEIARIGAGETDIIIGTQIVAKGHNFPRLTLVGVIDADLGLQGSDMRAAERSYQLIQQVSGRAGRTGIAGVGLLQTYQPEHPVIRAILAGKDLEFWEAESRERERAGMPPFGRLAGIILSASDVQQVFDLGSEMARADGPLRRVGAQVFGPAPAPIARIRGRHRVRLLVKAAKGVALQPALLAWIGQFKTKSDLRIQIDIDPQSFY